jgi:monoamine oxidase
MTQGLPVGIVGGGMAGLIAAHHLSTRGRKVVLFEARDRLGGRVRPHDEEGWGLPIELGAEFIHGDAEPALALADAVDVPVQAVPDRHAWRVGTSFESMGDTWKRFAKLLEGASSEPEESAAEYAKKHLFEREDADLVRLLIEDFHAAPLYDVSLRAMAKEARAAAEDPSQYRPGGGYGALLHGLERLLDPARVEVVTRSVVEAVQFAPGGPCMLTVRKNGSTEAVHVAQCVVTVPLGVLLAEDSRSIRFTPDLEATREALSGLAMGHALKLVIALRDAHWLRGLPGSDFFHDTAGSFPTFWQEHADPFHQLTAWAGGSKAKLLEALGPRDLVDSVASQLAGYVGVVPADVRESIIAVHHHDFGRDAFSLGAYPYARPGGSERLPEEARSVDHALFFAGDTWDEHHFGTVAGALASGARAATRILAL